jgi:hypothetical protein
MTLAPWGHGKAPRYTPVPASHTSKEACAPPERPATRRGPLPSDGVYERTVLSRWALPRVDRSGVALRRPRLGSHGRKAR